MDLDQIKLPEEARHYVTLKLMRANLANSSSKNPKIQEMGRDLFAAMLVNALKKRNSSQKNPPRFNHRLALVEKLKKIFKRRN